MFFSFKSIRAVLFKDFYLKSGRAASEIKLAAVCFCLSEEYTQLYALFFICGGK